MKKFALILIFSLILVHCKKSNEKAEIKLDSLVDSTIGENSKNKISDQLLVKQTIIIPDYKEFELNNIDKDSVHIYNGGDCSGNVSRFKIKDKYLTIDSLFCGDYGNTYTKYILDSKNSIELIFRESSKNIRSGIELSQVLIDFRQTPAITKERTDTIYTDKGKNISKEFIKDTLTDTQASYEHWILQYGEIWTLDNLSD